MAQDATPNHGRGRRRVDGAAHRRAAIQAAAVKSKKKSVRHAAERTARPPQRTAVPHDTTAEVFIAYAHKDTKSVSGLIDDLRQSGVTVTWDRDILGGRHFRKDIQSAIRSAAAAIVVWSDEAVESHFVIDEADLALAENKLLTTHVDGLDRRNIPIGFRQLQSISIVNFELIAVSLASFGVRVQS